MRKLVKLVVPVLAGGAGLFGFAQASDAQGPASTPLPISSFYQMAVDTVHSHIFFSQGSASQNGILVTNLAGKVVTTIGGQTGVMGIALSPDDSTLYAALGSGGAVTAISTTTLAQTASYPLPAGDTPQDVAVQSGKVWVSYGASATGQGAIGDIDVSAGAPSFETQAAMGGWYYPPKLAADPQDSGVVLAAVPGISPSSVATYNAAVEPVTVRAQSTLFSNCENLRDLAVAPGGAEFVLACGAPYAHFRYSTADLSQLGSYASTPYPNAVALDANGDVAAGTSSNVAAPDIYVYHPASSTLLNSYSFATSNTDLAPRGLAWLPDGSALLAVIGQGTPATSFSLATLAYPTLKATTLTLAGPSTGYLTRPVTLTGTLSGSPGTPLPAGTSIKIVRSVAGGTGTATFSTTTSATGTFSLTDTPTALGTYTYTARFAGNATDAPASAAQAVSVVRIPTALKLTTASTSPVYEPTLSLTAHLGTTKTNRTVSIYATPDGGGKATLLKTARVNTAGNLTVSYTAPHNTTFRAVFSGDSNFAPAAATIDVTVRVKVSVSVSGSYGTKLVGRITYRLFHHTNLVGISTAVAPNKAGHCITIEVQEYYAAAWHANSVSNCATLNSSSKANGTISVSQADLGYPYRIRIDYAGDTTNGANDSAWQYVMIEK